MNIPQRITSEHIDKVMSGRFLLTITVGACLFLMTATDMISALTHLEAKMPFDPSAIMTIVGVVVTFYFAKAPDSKLPVPPPELTPPPLLVPPVPPAAP